MTLDLNETTEIPYISLDVEFDCNDWKILSIYNPEPSINLEDLTNHEKLILKDVLDRNIILENIENSRSKNLQHFVKKYLMKYISYDKKKCSFCFSSFVAVINPSLFCILCKTLVCEVCLILTPFSDGIKRNVCIKCCVIIVCNNRIGEWFKEISEENNRKRISATEYIAKNLKHSKVATKFNEDIGWGSIDEALYKLQCDKDKADFRNQLNEERSTVSIQGDNRSTRRSTTTSSTFDTTDGFIIPSTVNLSISYNKRTFYFEIFISNCSCLPSVEYNLPNAFIKLKIEPFCFNFNAKSKVICANSNPIFNESFRTRLSEKKMKSGNLIVSIWSKKKIKKSKFIGEVVIPIFNTIKSDNGVNKTYKIKTSKETSLLRNSSLTNMSRINKLFSSLKKTIQTVSKSFEDEDFPDTLGEEDYFFSNEPCIYFTIKCTKSTSSSSFPVEINLLSIHFFDRIHLNSNEIRIGVFLIQTNCEEIVVSKSLSIVVDNWENDIKLDEKITLDIEADLEFSSLNVKFETYSENDELQTTSYLDYNYIMKSVKESIGYCIPVNMKMKVAKDVS